MLRRALAAIEPSWALEMNHIAVIIAGMYSQQKNWTRTPLGKLSQQSQPYAPNGNIYWTTYLYDGI